MKKNNKLSVARETLIHLGVERLSEADGGTFTTDSLAVCASFGCGASVGMGVCTASNNSCNTNCYAE